MITMKIQAKLRFNLSQKVGVLVGFLPGLADDLLVCPSPGIISPHVASLGLSCYLIPCAGATGRISRGMWLCVPMAVTDGTSPSPGMDAVGMPTRQGCASAVQEVLAIRSSPGDVHDPAEPGWLCPQPSLPRCS